MKWFSWFLKPAEKELKAGICQCGHIRCGHKRGKGECTVIYGKVRNDGLEAPYGALWKCACDIYIPDGDDNNGGSTPTPDPELEELRKLL